jgi:pimeloyl-ACP methyl ester carboxylesterase
LWDGTGNDFSFAQHADDVSAFIRQLALGPVHLLGHSRGGLVVIEVAKKHPDLIRTLILADIQARLELPETEENLKWLPSGQRWVLISGSTWPTEMLKAA